MPGTHHAFPCQVAPKQDDQGQGLDSGRGESPTQTPLLFLHLLPWRTHYLLRPTCQELNLPP